MGREELRDDPRFADNAARVANREATDALVATWTRTLGKMEGHRQLVGRVSRIEGDRQGARNLFLTKAADFCPDLEFLRPGSSELGGRDVIAAEMEQVVDLIVG